MPRLIIINGTPGVGKTVLGRALAKELGIPFFDLGTLVRGNRLHSGFDPNTRSMVLDTRLVRRFLEGQLDDGGVIATHVLADMIPGGRIVEKVVVLRLDPRNLWKRLRARGWTRMKAWENVESELVDICYSEAVSRFGKRKVFDLDTTGKPRIKVIEEAVNRLKRKQKNTILPVDWLKSYDPVDLSREFGVG